MKHESRTGHGETLTRNRVRFWRFLCFFRAGRAGDACVAPRVCPRGVRILVAGDANLGAQEGMSETQFSKSRPKASLSSSPRSKSISADESETTTSQTNWSPAA